MIWNPWKRIRELEREADNFEQWMDEMGRRVRDAEREAFYKASDHFAMRTKEIEAHNKQLLNALVDIKSMGVRPIEMLPSSWKGLGI